jgi:hypothetical protein
LPVSPPVGEPSHMGGTPAKSERGFPANMTNM